MLKVNGYNIARITSGIYCLIIIQFTDYVKFTEIYCNLYAVWKFCIKYCVVCRVFIVFIVRISYCVFEILLKYKISLLSIDEQR